MLLQKKFEFEHFESDLVTSRCLSFVQLNEQITGMHHFSYTRKAFLTLLCFLAWRLSSICHFPF